jgi:hypothetical protein
MATTFDGWEKAPRAQLPHGTTATIRSTSMRPPFAVIAACVATLVLAGASPAGAFDLTGHWQGKWSCTVFSNGVKSKVANGASTFAATSFGNGSFAAVVDSGPGYLGIEISDAAKPEKGELAIVHCGTHDDLKTVPFSELGRWKVTTKGAKGTIGGVTVWSNGPSHVATCKYKYKRVDTIDPNFLYLCDT